MSIYLFCTTNPEMDTTAYTIHTHTTHTQTTNIINIISWLVCILNGLTVWYQVPHAIYPFDVMHFCLIGMSTITVHRSSGHSKWKARGEAIKPDTSSSLLCRI